MKDVPVVSLHVLSREGARMCAATAAVTRQELGSSTPKLVVGSWKIWLETEKRLIED